MVQQSQLHHRRRIPSLGGFWRAMIFLFGIVTAWAATAHADGDASRYLQDAKNLYGQGRYFTSARYAFAAQVEDSALAPEAYSWMTSGLVKAGIYQASSYFFIRTLQSGNKGAIRRVLPQAEILMVRVGVDLLRKYLVKYTALDDYDSASKSTFLFALGKENLLAGHEEKAISYLNGVSRSSSLWPFALQLRGTAQAILGRSAPALQDFRSCADEANQYVSVVKAEENLGSDQIVRRLNAEADDLKARCIAGEARTLYQMERFLEADQVYDKIQKHSLVWPDVLFEQAWNAFGKHEYNRTLGKLVSYKSPALSFVFNSEVDVLSAQAYLALCLYSDANEIINQFHEKYTKSGEEMKRFVESNANNLPAFYEAGRRALKDSLHTQVTFHRTMNRFIRGPYFRSLVAAEESSDHEREAIARFSTMNASEQKGGGFQGFLNQVLDWRQKTIRMLGGAFVKNSLIDYHAILISDFDKISFIKLEMLSRSKDALMRKNSTSQNSRGRGNTTPSRRDDQYRWSFNGEFWNDELGDYVFALESECK